MTSQPAFMMRSCRDSRRINTRAACLCPCCSFSPAKPLLKASPTHRPRGKLGGLGRVEWIVIIGDSCRQTLAWLAAFAVGFGVLVRLVPCNRGVAWWNDLRAAGTDLLYWFLVPLFGRVGRAFLLAA